MFKFFDKKRSGRLEPTDDSGRRFVWTIEQFSAFKPGTTLDSDNVTCFNKTKFHFHMSLGTGGDVGVYIHYKSPPIPKYSYFFQNSNDEVMRQHTAHTIPNGTERCGHWNVCNHDDMLRFLGDSDVLRLFFSFDDDSIVTKRTPEQNTTSVVWTIPNLLRQNLNPFSSRGFFIDNMLLIARLDIKRNSPDVIAKYDVADINMLVIFLFCRKGTIPAHSIELIGADGTSFVKADRKEDGAAQTLLVSRAEVEDYLTAAKSLVVRINLSTGGNPLEALNVASHTDNAAGDAAPSQQVLIGDKKEAYDVMED